VRIASMMSKTHITKLLPTYHNSGVWTIVRIFFFFFFFPMDIAFEMVRLRGIGGTERYIF
jgi:hypothetical protein